MSEDNFLEELRVWKDELDEVISYFRARSEERGDIAFSRWKKRFASFLEDNYPTEAERFRGLPHHIAAVAIIGEHPYETFMRQDGRNCLAFIEDLEDALRKGRMEEAKPLVEDQEAPRDIVETKTPLTPVEQLQKVRDHIDGYAVQIVNRRLWAFAVVLAVAWLSLAALTKQPSMWALLSSPLVSIES